MRNVPALCFATGGVAVLLAGCASTSQAATAPQPTKPVDEARFYTGVWHEIARNPMTITNGCVAGATEFTHDPDGKLIDRDSCRKDTPQGEEKVFAGPVTVDPAAQGAKFTTHYKVVGPFGPSRTYWILDHDADYAWFIVATPDFKNLSIFTRDPQVSAAERDRLTARAKAFGYDVSRLEYPAQPPR